MSEDMVLEKPEEEEEEEEAAQDMNGDAPETVDEHTTLPPPSILPPPPRPPGAPLLPHPPTRMFRPRGHRFRHPIRGHHPMMMMRGPRHPMFRHPMGPPHPMHNGCPPPAPPGIPTNLWEFFHSADQDKDGLITATELQRILLNGDWAPFDEETSRLMLGMFDGERTGTMNAYHLVSLWEFLESWQETFKLMDPDKTGTVGPKQLLESLEKLGYNLSTEFCELAIARFDSSGEGKLKMGDFIRAQVMLKCLTQAFKAHDPNRLGTIDLHYEQFLEMVLDNSLRQAA